MKLYLKIAGIALAVLVVLLLAAPFVIPKSLYMNWAKQAVESRYPVILTVGDATIGFLPSPYIRLTNVDLKVRLDDDATAELIKAGVIEVATDWAYSFKERPSLKVLLGQATIALIEIKEDYYNFSPLLDGDHAAKLKKTGQISWGVKTVHAATGEGKISNGLTLGAVDLARLTVEETTLHFSPLEGEPEQFKIVTLVIDSIVQENSEVRLTLELDAEYAPMAIAGTYKVAFPLGSDSEGPIQLESKQVDFHYDDTVIIKKQPLKFHATLSRGKDKTSIQAGRLQLGPQDLLLHGEKGPDGLVIDLQAESVNVEFLKTIIPVLEKAPPMSGVRLAVKYQRDATKEAASIVSGQLQADQVRIEEYELAKVTVDMSYSAPKLILSRTQATIFGGTVDGKGRIDFAGAEPSYQLDLSTKNIKLQQIGDVGSMMDGLANGNIQVNGRGFKESELKANMKGKGKFSVQKIKLKKLKFFEPLMALTGWDPIGKVVGGVNKKKMKDMGELDKKVRDIRGKFTIAKGAIHFPDITVNFPQAHAKVAGRMGFDGKLAFKGEVTLSPGLMKSIFTLPVLRQVMADGTGVMAIPITISGDTSDPIVKADNNFLKGHFGAFLVKAPVNIVKGILTAPFRLFKKSSKEEDAESETDKQAD